MKKFSLKSILSMIGKAYFMDRSFYFFYLVKILLDSCTPFIMVIFPKLIIESIQSGEKLQNTVYVILLFTILSLAAHFLIIQVNSIMDVKNVKLDHQFMEQIIGKAMDLKLEHVEASKTLNKMELVKDSLDQTKPTGILFLIGSLITNANIFLGTLYIISFMGVIVIPVLIFVLMVHVIIENKRAKQRQQFEEDNIQTRRASEYQNKVMNDSGFAKEIRLFHLHDFILERYIGKLLEYDEQYYKTSRIRLVYYFISFFTEAFRDFVIYLLIGFKFLKGLISIGDFSMYLSAATGMYQSIASIFSNFVQLKTKSNYIGYLEEFMSMEAFNESENIERQTIKINSHDYRITFEHVFFRYEGQTQDSLNDINLEIKKGDRLGIVGENGAGKTTLVKLLLRLYKPTSGKIMLNGIDIQEYSWKEYCALFSAMFQESFVLPFTIKENIVFQYPIDSEHLSGLLEQALLKDKVDRLDEKEETSLSKIFDEKGIEFSGGEQQKLMLARGMFKKSEIFVFDEPTSALSPIAEYRLLTEFHKLIENKTMIYISHRMSFCRYCDKVIVIRGGSIIQSGSHEELVSQEGVYSDMYEIQSKWFQESLA